MGEKCYLDFMTGVATSGIYTVTSAPDSAHFTVVTTGSAAAAISGNVLVPKMYAYVSITGTASVAPNTITMTTNLNGNLNVGDPIWLETGSAFVLGDAQYTVTGIMGPQIYTLSNSGTYKNTTSRNQACTRWSHRRFRALAVSISAAAPSTWATPTARLPRHRSILPQCLTSFTPTTSIQAAWPE